MTRTVGTKRWRSSIVTTPEILADEVLQTDTDERVARELDSLMGDPRNSWRLNELSRGIGALAMDTHDPVPVRLHSESVKIDKRNS